MLLACFGYGSRYGSLEPNAFPFFLVSSFRSALCWLWHKGATNESNNNKIPKTKMQWGRRTYPESQPRRIATYIVFMLYTSNPLLCEFYTIAMLKWLLWCAVWRSFFPGFVISRHEIALAASLFKISNARKIACKPIGKICTLDVLDQSAMMEQNGFRLGRFLLAIWSLFFYSV